MIIDSHCHIYPTKIALKAVEAVEDFYEQLPGEQYNGTVETLKASSAGSGVTHCIVHSVATKPEQVSSINRFLARSMEESEGHFIALGTMHPETEDLKRDMDELEALGLHGVKIHPDIQRFESDSPKAMAIFAECAERGLPILVHTGDHRYDFSNPNRIIPVLKAFPDLKFIGAHFGGWSIWEEATEALSEYPNVWVDTSSSLHWLKPETAVRLIRAYGSKRVMFGTDYPLWHQTPEIEYLKKLPLTEEEQDDIFWRTCADLYKIPLK